MKLYLDSAQTDTWRLPSGCVRVQGVTTNPSLIRQAALPMGLPTYLRLIEQAAALGIPHLMLQLPNPDRLQSQRWAQELAAAAQQVDLALTLKLPCHPDWQAAHGAVKALGVDTLLTAVSNPMQLMWAAEQGAGYVAPYIGRLQAENRAVWPLMEACVALQNKGGPKLMAASVKTDEVLSRLLALGAHAVTVNPEFAAGLASDEVTQRAMAQFEQDSQDKQ